MQTVPSTLPQDLLVTHIQPCTYNKKWAARRRPLLRRIAYIKMSDWANVRVGARDSHYECWWSWCRRLVFSEWFCHDVYVSEVFVASLYGFLQKCLIVDGPAGSSTLLSKGVCLSASSWNSGRLEVRIVGVDNIRHFDDHGLWLCRHLQRSPAHRLSPSYIIWITVPRPWSEYGDDLYFLSISWFPNRKYIYVECVRFQVKPCQFKMRRHPIRMTKKRKYSTK